MNPILKLLASVTMTSLGLLVSILIFAVALVGVFIAFIKEAVVYILKQKFEIKESSVKQWSIKKSVSLQHKNIAPMHLR